MSRLMYVPLDLILQRSLILHRPKTRCHVTSATAHDLHHHSVEVATHLQMATTAGAHLPLVVTALVVMITVVVPHLPVMITTLVMVAIVPHHHLVRLVLLSMTLIHLLVVAMAVKTHTEHPHLVAAMKIPTLLMGTIDLGQGLHHRGHTGVTMSVPPQDTGDCSFP